MKISWRNRQRSWTRYFHDVFHGKVKSKHAWKRYNHRQENVTTKEKWLQVPGGVYTSPTTKLNVSYEEVLTKRGQDECQAAGREKNRWNEKPQRDFADKSYDNSIDWRKANLTKMVVLNEIWNKHVWKFGQWLCTIIIWKITGPTEENRIVKRGPSTRKGMWTQMTC